MPRSRKIYSDATTRLCAALGSKIARARRERRWPQAELAERTEVSLGTVRAVERGAPSVSLGVAFEAAQVLGIDLFGGSRAVQARTADNRRALQLLPQRVHTADVDDDF